MYNYISQLFFNSEVSRVLQKENSFNYREVVSSKSGIDKLNSEHYNKIHKHAVQEC